MKLEMDKHKQKKLIIEGEYEDIYEFENHYFIVNKKDTICVLPYTISSQGLLDQMGTIEEWNYIEEEKVLTLLNDYISSDDRNDLVAANRILYEVIGSNVEDADLWMYLGNVYNSMTSDSPIKLYAVDITNVEIENIESVEDEEERQKFKMLDSSEILQTDDIMMLSAYLRVFNHFYVHTLSKNKKNE